MFYYYAYLENGKCTDIERTKKQKTDLTDYVEVAKDEYDAYMNDETTSVYYIIGKVWNGSEWIEAKKYYYAALNNRGIVTDLICTEEEMESCMYIEISQAEYENHVHLHQKWNGTTFVDVPFSEYADTDTNRISVDGTNTPLQNLLAAMQAAIESMNCSMSAADILSALLSVDGSGSELDADTLDGLDSTAFARASHTHDTSIDDVIEFGMFETYGERGHYSHSTHPLKFTPRILVLIPRHEMMYESMRIESDASALRNVIRGGIFMQGLNDMEVFGCVIGDKKFTVYSNYDDDRKWIEMDYDTTLFIAIK